MLPWILLGWLVLINGVTFGVVGLDKRIAKRRERQPPSRQSRRIPERTLLGLGLLGGIWGLIVGMRRFRHKTRKVSFLFATVVILLVNIGYYYLIAVYGFGW